ncbi:hypothetical protein IAR50_001846 [Cryptococcus sp. DSM 104548]
MSLPQYHAVPADEKRPISPVSEADFDPRQIHPASIGLRVGGGSVVQQAKDKYTNMSKMKKALVALAVVWFTLIIAQKTSAGFSGSPHHGRHHHQDSEFGMQQWSNFDGPEGRHPHPMEFGHHGVHAHHHHQPEDLSVIETVYGEASVVGDATTAKVSYPVQLGRRNHLDLDFKGEGKLVVSRSTEEVEGSMVNVVVESTWTGEVEGVEMKSNERSHALSVESSETSSHVVHLILPANKDRLPSISIHSSKDIDLTIDPSAQNVQFRQLSFKTESGNINLSEVVAGKIDAETTTGNVGGTFNVTKGVFFKTVTGDIDATVNVKPPPHHPHHNGTHFDSPEFAHQTDLEGEHQHKGPKGEHKGEFKGQSEGEHKPHHKPGKGERKPRPEEDDSEEHEPKFHQKRGEQPEERHERHERHGRPAHREEREREEKPGWFSMFKSGASKKSQESDKPKHRGPPPPNKPVKVHAFSSTGAITLHVDAPPSISTRTKAQSHAGDVKVVAPGFHGHYDIGTFKGTYEVQTQDGKVAKVLKESIGEEAGVVFKVHGKRHFDEEETELEGEAPEEDAPRDGPPPHKHGEDKKPKGPKKPKANTMLFAHTDVGNVLVVL